MKTAFASRLVWYLVAQIPNLIPIYLLSLAAGVFACLPLRQTSYGKLFLHC